MSVITITDEDKVLNAFEHVVRVYANTKPVTITLPFAADGAGLIYSIVARTATSTNSVTIKDQKDSENWVDAKLNDKGEFRVYFSDGLKWSEMASSY